MKPRSGQRFFPAGQRLVSPRNLEAEWQELMRIGQEAREQREAAGKEEER